MTRDEWIDNVLKPWKQGDCLQACEDQHNWQEVVCGEPVMFNPYWERYEYRIKPRVKQVVIDVPENFNLILFLQLADVMKGKLESEFSPSFIEAIRNAKPLEGKIDES